MRMSIVHIFLLDIYLAGSFWGRGNWGPYRHIDAQKSVLLTISPISFLLSKIFLQDNK